jgi:hypothetical protein
MRILCFEVKYVGWKQSEKKHGRLNDDDIIQTGDLWHSGTFVDDLKDGIDRDIAYKWPYVIGNTVRSFACRKDFPNEWIERP